RGTHDVNQWAEGAGHPRLAVADRVVRLARAAVPAGVGGDDVPAGCDERRHHAGHDPVEVGVGDEPVVQQHRGLVGGRAPLVVDDLDAVVGGEPLHAAILPHRSRRGDRRARPGTRPLGVRGRLTRTCSTLGPWTSSGTRFSTRTTTTTRPSTPSPATSTPPSGPAACSG